MSLRTTLGADAGQVHQQVDALLEREDAMIVLIDGSRAISYATGFGISPSQLELLALEIERAVRRVAGPASEAGAATRTSTGMENSHGTGARGGDGARRRPARPEPAGHRAGDEARVSGQARSSLDGARTRRAVHGLRSAGHATAADTAGRTRRCRGRGPGRPVGLPLPAAAEPRAREHGLAAEQALDAALADSFPASDPPSWTLGVTHVPPPTDPTAPIDATPAAHPRPRDD